jgi:uncharacterized protein (TIGR03435 family)
MMATPLWLHDALTLAGNHVWQSTIFAAATAIAALVFRRHHATVRYWLWLTASVKFLIPFAVLAAVGSQISWRTVDVVPYEDPAVLIGVVSQPFSQELLTVRADATRRTAESVLDGVPMALVSIWIAGLVMVLLRWFVRWRRMRTLVASATTLETGREVDILRRLSPRYRVSGGLPVVLSDTPIEPGVFGIYRPVLLWPRGIAERLSDEQIEAVLAHELCHLRRRDNLAAALHMVVQAVFWFYPLVWWMGARLVDERERACDEEVIRRGSEPEVYAESILKTCKFFVESPLVCVSGVTGSDLKKRIEQIMTNNAAVTLNVWRKSLLVLAGLVAFVAPVAVGALNPPPQTREVSPPASLPTFEAVSIRPNVTPGPGGRGGQMQPGRFAAQNVTLHTLLKVAYARPGSAPGSAINLLDQQVAGGPEWLNGDKFDIVATAGSQTPPPQMRLMVQRMLAERFKLAAHWESREMPVYVLVKARPDGKLGAGLTPTSDAECEALRQTGPVGPPEPGKPAPPPPCGAIQFGPGQLVARGAPLEWLANVLVTVPVITGIDRPVINKTGVEGNFGFTVKFAPAQAANPDPDRPQLFTALEEQLGLKLESSRAPIDVLIVDSAQKPDPN